MAQDNIVAPTALKHIVLIGAAAIRLFIVPFGFFRKEYIVVANAVTFIAMGLCPFIVHIFSLPQRQGSTATH